MRRAFEDLAAVLLAGVIVVGLLWSILALARTQATEVEGNGNAAGPAVVSSIGI